MKCKISQNTSGSYLTADDTFNLERCPTQNLSTDFILSHHYELKMYDWGYNTEHGVDNKSAFTDYSIAV